MKFNTPGVEFGFFISFPVSIHDPLFSLLLSLLMSTRLSLQISKEKKKKPHFSLSLSLASCVLSFSSIYKCLVLQLSFTSSPYTFLPSSLHIEQSVETMEDLSSLWRFQENVEELKQKLQQTTYELEILKMEANEESMKNKEKVKSLLLLLQAAYGERDEARDQLQKLMNIYIPTTAVELPALLHLQPESPLSIPTKANSSITESNSLYETYNHQSYGSSPADSFFDGVSSPDFSTANMADSSKISFVNQPFVMEYNEPQLPLAMGADTPKAEKADPFSAVIDNLVKGKALPQKGKLLQAVTEAGPLLQTLLVAGPLPQWRNPPPLQAFKIPSLLVNGCHTNNISRSPPSKFSSPSPKPLHSLLHTEMSRGSSQICSASSMFNFNNSPSGSCFNSAMLIAPNVNTQIMPSSSSPPSPVPDYSSWTPWSISAIAFVCFVFLLLSNYRILKRLYRILYGCLTGRPRVQLDPNDPSPEIPSHGLQASTISLLPNCNHSFHSSCIDAWFRDHPSCPLCRSPVLSFSIDCPNSDSSSTMAEALGRDEVRARRVAHYQAIRAQVLQSPELRTSIQGGDRRN